MKILIYGFKPYKEYKTNISESVVKKLKIEKRFKVEKTILPVVFKKNILKKIQEFKPDIIIGLGQKPRGRLLEIEKTAKNVYDKDKLKIIEPGRPKRYFLNLEIKAKLRGTKINYISGYYVCNFTRYIIMDFIKRNRLKTKFIFIHIPNNHDIQKATDIIQKIMQEIIKNYYKSS